MLKMKSNCEKCNLDTGLTAVAYICSYECTFCEACSKNMDCICPNCQGNLVLRPIRTKSPREALMSRIKKKVFGL
ncbi:DUF1272 domain-containing protein [Psychrobacter sp. SC65A.3]|uniref:DUF1272 domain-containing protein n=1 Tax=Psychrobacter sp. SC65A.3 TaxID=2983299 RepID=UPI003FA3BAD4